MIYSTKDLKRRYKLTQWLERNGHAVKKPTASASPQVLTPKKKWAAPRGGKKNANG